MMTDMRTTVTIDDDVAARLDRIMRERGLTFKEALNQTLRAGLGSVGATKPYRVPVHDLKANSGVDLTHALRLAGQLEDDELLRRVELHK